MAALSEALATQFGGRLECLILSDEEKDKMDKADLVEKISEEAAARYEAKEAEFGSEQLREIERVILLKVVDSKWTEHIDDMDQMRQGIQLRAYGQRDPVVEFKFLSYDMFDELNTNIQLDTIKALFNIRIQAAPPEREQVAKATFTNRDESASSGPKVRKQPKIGRNAPCPCGSGKKYKDCCGKNA